MMDDDLAFSENSLIVVRNKYLQKDENGKIVETPLGWLQRVARALALSENNGEREKWREKFLEVMLNFEFLPAGRTLANAGTVNGQLANCFVLPMEDNIEEIFESIKDAAILKKNGGGVGFSFGKIRPKRDAIYTTTGRACGPVAIMKVLDASSEILLQDGGRRSGNMVVLPIKHPDLLEFISCKDADSDLMQINYSVGVFDKFMKKMIGDSSWDFINPRTGRMVSSLGARTIFDLISAHAHKNGDPGLIFLDAVNRDNPTPLVGPLEAVNLCGEQPLLPFEACNLGSLNLVKFVNRSDKVNKGDKVNIEELVNWKRLEEVVRIGTRMLDNVVSVCRYPLPQVDRVVKANRKIGLGVMGFADMLIELDIAYGSKESFSFGEKLMKFITQICHEESQKLGEEKGDFPNFKGSTWDKKKKFKNMRNATCTTIAPTGSLSLVCGVSSGIEPIFALSFYRQAMGGVKLPEVNPRLMIVLKEEGLEKYQEEIIASGSLKNILGIPAKIKKVFATAMDINPLDHVRMQAAFQKYTDNAVSKTINLPEEAKVADVSAAFLLAWKLGCKGITVYRDKSKSFQVLNVGAKRGGAERESSCPNCQTKLVSDGGCQVCPSCGYSVCSI